MFVNGNPMPIGYLSNLRVLPGHRGARVIAGGYRFLKQLHEDGKTPLYLTTITEDNERALSTLTSGRAGLPPYHDAGRYYTVIIPPRRANPKRRTLPTGVGIRPAAKEDTNAVVNFLNRNGPRRQFFPAYEEADFLSPGAALKDLSADDLLLAVRGSRIVGTLAGWNQQRFRQTIVEGYRPPLQWLRPAYNAWSGIRGLPALPAPGQPFAYITGALPVVQDDDPSVIRALLDRLLDRIGTGGHPCLLAGFADKDPLLPLVRKYGMRSYITRLYHVCWEDGEELRTALDGRAPYLELGSL
jgi:hypothetical protein